MSAQTGTRSAIACEFRSTHTQAHTPPGMQYVAQLVTVEISSGRTEQHTPILAHLLEHRLCVSAQQLHELQLLCIIVHAVHQRSCTQAVVLVAQAVAARPQQGGCGLLNALALCSHVVPAATSHSAQSTAQCTSCSGCFSCSSRQ
jgi:hypothetical protein